MNFLFFDTETTGKPRDWRAKMTDVDNWPRVIQLAWVLTDEEGTDLTHGNHLIRPDGWTIPDGKNGEDATFWLEHGFSTEKSLAEGIDLAEAVAHFLMDLGQTQYLVSHNMDFDYNVLGAECIRLGLSSQHRPKRLCTKELATDYCKIPFPGRKSYPGAPKMTYKWPKLEELHRKLFAAEIENAHDAMGDVRAVKACFLELRKRGVIRLQSDDDADPH